MSKNIFSQFNIPARFSLVLAAFFCLSLFSGCSSNGVSQKPPPNDRQPKDTNPLPVDPIVLPTPSDGHFYRLMGGGSLQNFPYERYVTDIDQPYYQQPKYQQPIVISSKDQVDEFFSETYSQSFSEGTGSWVRDDRFTDLINSYDEEFFESNELVTFILGAAGGGYHFELSKTTFENEVLTIEVDHIFSGPGTAVITDWFGIVEIEKKPIDYQIEIQLNDCNW
jgi:hypothetical protein